MVEQDRVEVDNALYGIAALSGEPRDTLNRIVAQEKPTRQGSTRETMRSKIDTGACESVVNQMVAVDYPTFEIEASKRGLGFVSASATSCPTLERK